MLGTLAIVGAPSSGKSTIFNRFLGERRSIVEETPGVTRDRLYAHAEWLTKHFTIIDTGGIQIANAPFQVEIRAQVEIAIEEADVLLFVVDGKRGVTDDDRFVARMLQKAGKPVILAVNKVDNVEELAYAADFYSLGLGDPIAVSGAHGIGIGDLLDKIVLLLPERAEPDYGEGIAFALIGMLTATWRCAGTIPSIVCYAFGIVRPSWFLIASFLINSLISFLTGTSFGSVATMGVICMTMGNALGISPALTGGAILSGIFFSPFIQERECFFRNCFPYDIVFFHIVTD